MNKYFISLSNEMSEAYLCRGNIKKANPDVQALIFPGNKLVFSLEELKMQCEAHCDKVNFCQKQTEHNIVKNFQKGVD